MKQKFFRCALNRAFSAVSLIVALLANMLASVSCSTEEYTPGTLNANDTIAIINNSERILTISAKPVNAWAKSDVSFLQKSYVYNSNEDFKMDFAPELYAYARLYKPIVTVAADKEVKPSLISSSVIKDEPFASGTKRGRDIVRINKFDDGQIDTIYYGWRYPVIANEIIPPHGEITAVKFIKAETESFNQKTETEDPHKVTLTDEIEFISKNVSGKEVVNTVEISPWYRKVLTSDAETVISVAYDGKFVGCPYTAYELSETVVTNKGTKKNTYQVALSSAFNAPALREQPTLDSLFSAKSTGDLKQSVFAEVKNADGFTVRTMQGTYKSVNSGLENKTSVESVINFTYQLPIKFESAYGSYDISARELTFTELGFDVNKIAETKESKTFKSVNTVQAVLGDCMLDVIDEVVNLKITGIKPDDIVKVDSTYTQSGEGNDYIITKVITWSDGSKTEQNYSCTGRHNAAAKAFGEVITSSLNWTAQKLTKASVSTNTETKKFSAATWFSLVYTTANWQSTASNGSESGVFSFEETSPVVTFYDGATKLSFPARKYQMTDLGASLSNVFSEIVRNNITYKAYPYNYTVSAAFTGETPVSLVSEGLLLMPADEIGETTYTPSISWNGNTATLKVVKTTKHSAQKDEVETFTYAFKLDMGNLTKGRLDAENTDFATTVSSKGENTSSTDGPWTIKTYTMAYYYVTSNQMVQRYFDPLTVTDGEVTFNDGSYTHTFNLRLNMSKTESLGAPRTEGDYTVTPHTLTVTGTTSDGKTLSTQGITDIYVKKQASVTGSYQKVYVYSDGTVDAVLTKTKSDGSTETLKASDAFGSRFAFKFVNAEAQQKVVSNVSHQASATTGTAAAATKQKQNWTVTEYTYPYTYTLSNGKDEDKLTAAYSYNNYKFVLTDADLGEVTFNMPNVTMNAQSLNIGRGFDQSGYTAYPAKVVVRGEATGDEGSYLRDLTVTHTLKVQGEPDSPNLGKPKGMIVTATYDPGSKVTRRAFVFNWEDGVTYAVCDYDTELPGASEFLFKEDSYAQYNSVGYDKNSTDHWQPARGVDSSDGIRWYFADGSLMSAIDKALTCKTIGWRNVVNGKYAMEIPGYTYEINGYYITVTSPKGQTVTFNSHHK